jgi:hypothetical protein
LVFYGNITGDGAGFLIFLLWSFQAKAASHGYLQTIIQQFLETQHSSQFYFPVVQWCNPGRKLNQNSVRRRLLNHQLDYLIVAIGFYWHFLERRNSSSSRFAGKWIFTYKTVQQQ